VQDLQVSFHMEKNMKGQATHYSEGLTNSLSSYTESARLFIEEGTNHVAYISVSIIPFTRRGVRKIRYRSTIGQFHGPFGR